MLGQQSKRLIQYFSNTFNPQEKTENCIDCENHPSTPVQYFCLSESCTHNRLLCKKCVKQSHRKHKIGMIDKIVEPLNRLSMNSCYQDSQENYNYLQSKIQLICNEWQKIEQLFKRYKKELQNGIIFQLATVMSTFSSEQVDRAEQAMLSGNSKLDAINEFVAKINFLNKDCLQDVEKVKKYADIITNRTKKTIKKAADTIESVFKKMEGHIKEIDFNNCNVLEDMQENTGTSKQNNKDNRSAKNNPEKRNGQGHSDEDDSRSKTSKKVKEEQTESSTQRYGTGYSQQTTNGVSKLRKN